MKKYIYLFSFALLGLTSCGSDYLETAPEDKMGTSTVLGTTGNAALSINGICKAMTNQYLSTQGLNGEGSILNWYGTFTGNDGQKCNQTGWAALWNSTYHLRKSSIYLYYPWFYYYKLVGNANGIICNIDNAEGTDAEKAFLKAQALTFRAYSFFRLAQLYSFRWKDTQGNTPGIALRLDQSTGDLALSTLAETYAQIYKDLDEAISLFKQSGMDRGSSEFYKPGIDVAYAIYAKAALTREDWQTAANYAALAREGHALMNESQYKDGFHTPNSEWIWGVYESQDQTIYYYSFFAYQASNASSSMQRTYPLAISKELYDQIPTTDARRKMWLEPTAAEAAELNAAGRSTKTLYKRAFAEYGDKLYSTSLVYQYMQFKFLATFMPGGGSFNIYRSAEMYLAEAEAKCHLGQDASAQALLNELNKNLDPSYNCTKTGADLLKEVKLYRRVDLWGEGFDWYDYKRWNEPIVRKNKAQGGNFNDAFAVTINVEDGNRWTWKIPRNETDYNKLISLE